MTTRSDQQRWIEGIAVGLIVTVIGGLLVGTLQGFFQGPRIPESQPVTSTKIGPNPSTTQSHAEADAPTPTTRTQPTTPTPSVDSAPRSIEVRFGESSAFKVGARVGTNLWQLQDWGGIPTAYVGYAWEARSADGVAIEGDHCQMLITFDGPGEPAAQRSADCAHGIYMPLNSNAMFWEINQPGEYRVTVTDQISGITGSASFEVVS